MQPLGPGLSCEARMGVREAANTPPPQCPLPGPETVRVGASLTGGP